MSGSGNTSGSRRIPLTTGATGPWLPQAIAQVAAGYWWDSNQATGLGSAAFAVPEGNGNATFALMPTSATAFPTTLTGAGGTQLRMRNAADANPSCISTLAAVVAGWTGSTYLAGWFRLPDAAGAITGNGNLATHGIAAGGQLRINHTLTALSGNTQLISADGTTTGNNTYANVFAGGWVWVELFTPDAAGATNATRIRLFANGIEQTKTGGSGDGVVPASIANSSSKIGVACRVNNTLANVDTTDWTTVYYANGIPSQGNRDALMRHRAPA